MYVDDELRRDPTPIFRKIVVKAPGGGYQVYAVNPAVPFSRLPKDALLDSADLCALFACSARSLYRWIAERDLEWTYKVGREYLFTKEDILDWYEDNRPRLGRPPTYRR